MLAFDPTDRALRAQVRREIERTGSMELAAALHPQLPAELALRLELLRPIDRGLSSQGGRVLLALDSSKPEGWGEAVHLLADAVERDAAAAMWAAAKDVSEARGWKAEGPGFAAGVYVLLKRRGVLSRAK